MVLAPLSQESIVNPFGAALDVQPAGQDPVSFKAPVDAIVHHLPQTLGPVAQVDGTAACFFVCPFHLRDGLPRTICHFKHLGR